MKDIAKLSPHHQTSSLESYHSVINHFVPNCWHFHTLASIAGTYIPTWIFNKTCEINKFISKISGYHWQHYILTKNVTESKPRHGMGLSIYILYILSRNRESIHQSLYQFLKHTVSNEKQLKLIYKMLYFCRLCGRTHEENITLLQNR